MQVLKRSLGKFDVWHPDKLRDLIHLDFCPFLSLPGVTDGVFLHFQAKPRGMRQWGIYSINSDQYFSRPGVEIEFWGMLRQAILDIDEIRYKTNPTALFYYAGATAIIHPVKKRKVAIAPKGMRKEVERRWKSNQP